MQRIPVLFIILFFTVSSFAQSNEKSIDSLKVILDGLHSNTPKKVEVLLQTAELEVENELFDAEMYAGQALTIATALELPELKGKSYFLLGDIAEKEGMYDTAVMSYNKALLEFKSINNQIEVARTINRLGLIKESMGDYPGAFKMYLDALKIHEAVHNIPGIAGEYLNIGLINHYRKNYTAAEKYFLSSLQLAEENNLLVVKASALNNLGMNYQENKDYGKALNYYQKVLEIDRESGNKSNIDYSLNNIGAVYIDLKKYNEASKYFKSSIALKEELNDLPSLINGYNNLAECYLALNNNNEAQLFLIKALDIAKKYGLNENLNETYLHLYELNKKLGKTDIALEYFINYSALRDSQFYQDKEVAIEQLQKQYEFDKITNKLAEQEEEIERDRVIKLVYLGAVVLLLLLLIISYYSFRRIRQLNKELNEHQKEIEQQYESLRVKNVEIAKARQYAEDAAKSKGQFLSVMSHEIRTPLNAIIGVANLINESEFQGEQKHIMQILKTSSDNLMALINDILDVSKIESGKLHLEYVDFNLKDVVKNLYDLFNFKAKEKGLDLQLNFDSKLNQKLLGDPLRINQILSNLIGNAIKFTEKGFVQINVRKVGEGKDYNDVHFEVKDSGIGIPDSKQNSIFETFEQADKNTTRIYGGTGLGLSISKQLLEMLGSDLLLKSVEQEGSTFYFTIRFNKVHSDKAENTIEDNEILSKLKGKRILIAEDNPVNIYILKQFLGKWQMQVKVADDGVKAVEMATNYNFDVILMDINMPVLDGYEAARKILAVKPTVPIIAITATTLAETTELMKKSGIIDYVPKPFQPSELVDKILKSLNI